jgi:nucleoside-diphosphate-sugar epimerase
MLRHLEPAPVKPRRVVVVGAAGFVGVAVCRQLVAAGVETLPVTRAECDLLDANAIERLANLLRDGDAIVAASAIAPCKNIDMLIDNMRLTRALVGAIGRTNASHVVNISSDAVYGDEPVPLTESAPAAPASFHGAMHLAREITFQSDVKAPLAVLRPTLIYGSDDPHNGYGPNRFRRLAAKGEDIVLFGAGEERRDHVWIEDVAEIVVRVIAAQGCDQGHAALRADAARRLSAVRRRRDARRLSGLPIYATRRRPEQGPASRERLTCPKSISCALCRRRSATSRSVAEPNRPR